MAPPRAPVAIDPRNDGFSSDVACVAGTIGVSAGGVGTACASAVLVAGGGGDFVSGVLAGSAPPGTSLPNKNLKASLIELTTPVINLPAEATPSKTVFNASCTGSSARRASPPSAKRPTLLPPTFSASG